MSIKSVKMRLKNVNMLLQNCYIITNFNNHSKKSMLYGTGKAAMQYYTACLHF